MYLIFRSGEFISIQERILLGQGLMDSGKTIQKTPVYCSWCMICTEKISRIPLLKTGVYYCSRSCFVADRYEKIRNSTLFLLIFAIIFPLIVIVPYPEDKMLLLGDFAGFYIIFVIAFPILFYLTFRSQLARKTRPRGSRIRS